MGTVDPVSFRTTCVQNGLSLSDEQLKLLGEYALRLLEWNKKINMISRRDEENFWTRHILHCLGLVFKLEIPRGAKILDLGTGGGLPGIVLKIVRPDLQFTLLDSTQKKINVVNDLLGSLGLDGIHAVWGRAEDIGKQREHAGCYDIVVARAVAPLKDLVRWAHPFLKRNAMGMSTERRDEPGATKKRINGSALVASKGGDLESEIGQLRNESGVGSISTVELILKGSAQLDDSDKKIVVVEYMPSNK